MEYYDNINEQDVWVTVQQPFVFNKKTREYVLPDGYCVAFKVGTGPAATIGEYLRDDNKQLVWFRSANEAVTAAFDEATKRLN